MGSALISFLFTFSARIRRGIKSEFPRLKGEGWALMGLSIGVSIMGSMAFSYALLIGKVALTAVFTESQPLFVFFFSVVLSRFFKWADKEDLSAHALTFKGLALAFIGLGLVLLYL
jgi:hypothetical protein